MGEAIFTAGHRGMVKIYRWKMYNAVSTTTYTWNKWNTVTTTTYYWNKWSTDIKYTWNKWNSNATYTWNKWNAVQSYNITKTADTGAIRSDVSASNCWNANEYYVDYRKRAVTSTTTWAWCFGLINSTSGRWVKDHIAAGTLAGRIVPMGTNWTTSTSGSNEIWWYLPPLGVCNGQYRQNGNRYDLGLSQIWNIQETWIAGNASYGTVTSTNASAYPNGGYHTDGYYYNNRTVSYSRGSYIGTVTANNNANAYPNGARHTDGYWYDGRTQANIKGTTSYGQVNSTNSGAYPSPGVSGSYWYESAGSQVSYSKGSTLQGTVKSTNASAYPNGGRWATDGFWYDGRTSSVSWSMGTYVQDVVSTDRKAYPDNDRVGNYWYVYQGES